MTTVEYEQWMQEIRASIDKKKKLNLANHFCKECGKNGLEANFVIRSYTKKNGTTNISIRKLCNICSDKKYAKRKRIKGICDVCSRGKGKGVSFSKRHYTKKDGTVSEYVYKTCTSCRKRKERENE